MANEQSLEACHIKVLRSKAIINVQTSFKINCIKHDIESETKIPVANQVLLNDGGVIIHYEEAISPFFTRSSMHLAVIGDVPSEAESWLKANDISPIKTFQLRFLTKIDPLSITKYNTILKIKYYIENQYKIRHDDQVLLFKGEEVKEYQSVYSLMMNDQREPLSDDFGFDLVVVKKPYTLRVKHFYKNYDREFEKEYHIEVQDTDTIGEIKEKIAAKKGIPKKYIQLMSGDSSEATYRLDDDFKTMEELDLGLHPVLWIKHVILIHLIFHDSRFSYHEILGKNSTLDDILLKIRESLKLKTSQRFEVFDRFGAPFDPDSLGSYNTDEIQITVYGPIKRSCLVM